MVRTAATVRFTAPGGDAKLLGTYFADDGQFFEARLLVDHAYPNCKSDVLYKGALQGDPDSTKPDAHTVWIGDVLIRAEATGTDTFEVNRNLLLTDGYPSIGCRPCTRRVEPGEDPRAGRWAGLAKTECGLHT